MMKRNTFCGLTRVVAAGTVLAALAGPATEAAETKSASLGSTDTSQQMAVAMVLPSRDPAGAGRFVARVSTPGDALFHHYLTTTAFAARFGASTADYDYLVSWARAHGLVEGERVAARNVLVLRGSAGALEAALGVHFSNFRDSKGHVFYAADSNPHLPSGVAQRITGVLGLSSEYRYAPLVRKLPTALKPTAGGTGPGGAYAAADLRTAYSVPQQPFPKRTEVVGLFEQGGFDQNDVATYLSENNLPTVPVVVRGVNGYGGGINDPGIDLEAVLDIDMVLALNPAAAKIIVYEDGYDPFGVALVASLAVMADENKAQTISISYGLDEALQGTDQLNAENTVLTQLAAQGQSVFASSGDYGAYGDDPPTYNVNDPGAQPLVTSVGGTTLYTVANEAYSTESAWNQMAVGAGGTGGGVSMQWKIPKWQKVNGVSVAKNNGGSSKYRNVPDVAAVASPVTGVSVYSALNGGWLQIGGTSASAPIWAGVMTLANSTSKGLGFGQIGFANPSLYGLENPNLAISHFFFDFNDIADGNNGDFADWGSTGYNAGYNYDNTTGLGSMFGINLVYDLALIPTSGNSNPPPPPNGLRGTATPTSVKVVWTATQGVTAYLAVGYYANVYGTVGVLLRRGTTAEFTGLAPNTNYVFQVIAISPGGTANSVPLYVSTPPG